MEDSTSIGSSPTWNRSQSSTYAYPTIQKSCLEIDDMMFDLKPRLWRMLKIMALNTAQMTGPAALPCSTP